MTQSSATRTTTRQLAEWVRDARQRTFELVADLSEEQLLGPQLDIVNPLLWEIGHVAWFQERWVLRHALGHQPIRPDVDTLYDSATIPHDTRWDLALPSRDTTLSFLRAVRDAVLEVLDRGESSARLAYFVQLAVFHEDMHTEAFTYARQTHGWPAPTLGVGPASPITDSGCGPHAGDCTVPGGQFMLGADRVDAFVFDNEKWAHPVRVEPFAIARAPVTQSEFVAFVEGAGYSRREFWNDDGWRWRESAGAEHPVYWRRDSPGNWQRRDFDQWVRLEPHRPVIHVNWFEASAYCRWAGRRLTTELEWEVATAGQSDTASPRLASTPPHSLLTTHLSPQKRRFPWGDHPPAAEHANLNWHGMGCVDVAAFLASDSAFGCRQMIGNVWEWTASDFLRYPGFVADPYKEYSQPWFGTHKVLRGGCWVTRSRLLRNTWRNFYTPDRRDVWAGFRTCALEP